MKLILIALCFFVVACKPEISKPEGEVLKIQRVVSAKGIKAWLVEDNSHPIIALKFTFKGSGSINETIDTQGTARILSNTMDEGADDLTSQEFQKELGDHSITLRFSSGRDNFGGNFKTLTRHQDKAFELLKKAVNKPRFDEEPLERMKQANIARIKSKQGDPDWIRARLVNDIIYQGHPYGMNSGGTISGIKGISKQNLENYHQKFIRRDNLIISAVGDIDAKTLARKIDDVFGTLPESKKQKQFEDFSLQNAGKTYIYEKDIPQSLISMMLPSIDKKDPDYYAARVMNIIFGGGGFGSRLMEEIREKRGLTYGIYSGLFHHEYIDGFRISSSTKNESAAEMIQIVKEEMLKFLEDVTEEEIQKAKSYITGSLPLSLTTTTEIANVIQRMQIHNREIDYLDHFTDKINAVTVDDIKKVAAKILKPGLITTIIVGKPDNIENFEVLSTVPNVE